MCCSIIGCDNREIQTVFNLPDSDIREMQHVLEYATLIWGKYTIRILA
jgi:hypothetical protein